MNDIEFCKGTDCPLKDNCSRFILGLNAPKFSWWIEPLYKSETNSCELYRGN